MAEIESGNGNSRATITRPRPSDPSKSAIENALELTELAVIGPDIFTNTRPLWHPPGARGIYGGAVIAQCLAAAQLTVPSHFAVHSMHCYFVLAGDATIPVLYHVEHVREGKSFATRTVQARQRGKPIFTTTLSFMRKNSGGPKRVNHEVPMPPGLTPPPDKRSTPSEKELMDGLSPFENYRLETINAASSTPHTKITRQWIRARGQISADGGHEAHLSALAYMSDSHFIGTISRIHKIWRYSLLPSAYHGAPETPRQAERRKLIFDEGFGDDIDNSQGRPEIGMMVSLDHSIYFHEPRAFRADEWIFTEMNSPWAGDGRGVVTQKMWGKDGRLIATCFQEGVVRLKQDRKPVPITDGKAKL